MRQIRNEVNIMVYMLQSTDVSSKAMMYDFRETTQYFSTEMLAKNILCKR